jgi:hypothetical protein
MKKAFSLLFAFMFLQAQIWALSGGPVFVTNGNTDLTGAYSGVLVSKTFKNVPPDPNSLGAATGVFNISVPVSGAATGTVFVFQENETYTAVFNGASDNKKRTITGILDAPAGQNGATFQTLPLPITPVALYLIGTFQAKVARTFATNAGNAGANGVSRNAPGNVGGATNGVPNSLGQFGDTVTGTAVLDTMILNLRVAGGPTVVNSTKYSVSGVRNTNVVAAAAP